MTSSTVGDGMYSVCAALYFTRFVHLSATQLGLGLTIAWTAGLMAGVPLGRLADRCGRRGVALTLCLAAGAMTATFLAVSTLAEFVAAATAFAVCSRGSQAAQQALLGSLVDPTEITITRAYIISRLNAGLALGAALGGLVLLIGTRVAYQAALAADATTFVIAALVLARLPSPPMPDRTDRARPRSVWYDRPYVIVSLANLILVLYVPLIDVALPLWVVRHTAAPQWIVAAILVLNTALVVIAQVRIAAGVSGVASAVRFVRTAAVLLVVACVTYAASSIGSSPWLASALLLTAAAVMTMAELHQTAGTSEISFALAPPSRLGEYQAFFGMGLTAAEAIGPLLLTTLLVSGGAAGWLLLGALFLVAGVAIATPVRASERHRHAMLAAARVSDEPRSAPSGVWAEGQSNA